MSKTTYKIKYDEKELPFIGINLFDDDNMGTGAFGTMDKELGIFKRQPIVAISHGTS